MSADGSCHCLCGLHKADGMHCRAVREIDVWLDAQWLGRPVPMCSWCGEWWRVHKPERVQRVASLPTRLTDATRVAAGRVGVQHIPFDPPVLAGPGWYQFELSAAGPALRALTRDPLTGEELP